MRIPFSDLRLPGPTELIKTLRQLESDMETVVNVLKPGPLGVIEHKFSALEIENAKATVTRAINNWRKNTVTENSGMNFKPKGDTIAAS